MIMLEVIYPLFVKGNVGKKLHTSYYLLACNFSTLVAINEIIFLWMLCF